MNFTGFSKASIAFLKNLAANNNKEWFENNKSLYQEQLLTPLRQLSSDLGEVISSIDKEIETAPMINKTISKIYRDIRFSHDKAPFRTDQWLSFRRPNKIWGNVPEFYFYFTPVEYQYGMGFYEASSENIRFFREYINRYPERFLKIVESYDNHNRLNLVGEDYKRVIPNDFPKKIQPWYQKKNFAVSFISQIDDSFFEISLRQDIEDAFKFSAEFYQFIIASINHEV